MPNDSKELRETLKSIFPSLEITGVAPTSGQRVVYFGHFIDGEDIEFTNWHKWGTVVIKIVEGITAESLTYLQREISILSEINSSRYPKLYFYETFYENPITEIRLKNRLFITIEEHIESKPLSECISNYRDELQVIELLLELIDSLRLLWEHRNKIVHRDIKPDNILIRPDGRVAIIDLGITRETGSPGVTNTHFPFGPMTLLYASPEQATNDKQNITFKSDCFSLGVIAYELLSGENPFGHPSINSPAEIYSNLLHKQPESLEKVAKVSHRFACFISKLLEKQPFRRFRTIESLVTELNLIKELQ